MHKRSTVALASVAAMLAGAGIAAAANPDSGGVINACYKTSTGALRTVDADTACRADEKPLAWNQTGPQGVPGADGRDGQDGAPGPAGPAGPSDAWSDSHDAYEVVVPGGRYHVVAARTLPAGNYIINGDVALDTDRDAWVRCALRTGGTVVSTSLVSLDYEQYFAWSTAAMTAAVTLSEQAEVDLACKTSQGGVAAAASSLTAIKVTTLH